MKTFKVNEDLRPYIEKVLERKKIPFLARPNTFKVGCTGRQFHLAVTRARCEKRNKEENLPYDQTYFIKKIESINQIREENSEYVRFIEM